MEATDVDILARAIAWAGETEAARDQAFNVTNGDVFRWQEVWPAIADALGMRPGEARPSPRRRRRKRTEMRDFGAAIGLVFAIEGLLMAEQGPLA